MAPSPDAGTPSATAPLVDVFDWQLERTTMPEVLRRLRRAADRPRLVMTVNTATMWMATVDPALARVVQDSDLRVVDGMGVLWAMRLLGRRLPERIAGIDLMSGLVAAAAEDGRSIYLLGATPEVVEVLQRVLLERHPGLRIAGARDGYFGPEEHPEVIERIRRSGADILFIGMPSPFKELWAAEHLDEFGTDLVLGVGGSFDVLSGFVRRAPRPLQRIGLEWAWRLACEPRRMWKRYAVTNAWLARRVVVELVRGRRRAEASQPV